MNLCFNPYIDDTKNVHIARLRKSRGSLHKGFIGNLLIIWTLLSVLITWGLKTVIAFLAPYVAIPFSLIVAAGIAIAGALAYKQVKYEYLSQCSLLMKFWMGAQYAWGDWRAAEPRGDPLDVRTRQLKQEISKKEEEEIQAIKSELGRDKISETGHFLRR